MSALRWLNDRWMPYHKSVALLAVLMVVHGGLALNWVPFVAYVPLWLLLSSPGRHDFYEQLNPPAAHLERP